MSTPPTLTAEAMYAAAAHLTQTGKGREVLVGLESFFDRGMSLDAGNARACLTLLEGFFGSWTGSALDAVREAAAKTG
jgi:hypothetical protein